MASMEPDISETKEECDTLQELYTRINIACSPLVDMVNCKAI